MTYDSPERYVYVHEWRTLGTGTAWTPDYNRIDYYGHVATRLRDARNARQYLGREWRVSIFNRGPIVGVACAC